ncbi:MAG TPA: hypothetical protein VGF38_02580 [Ktedonobacterales bacterium]|jgi:hypothetical protein
MMLGSIFTALLVLAACGSSTSTGGTSPTATATPATSPTATLAGYPVKVFFSKTPDSENSFNATFPVNRVSPTSQVESYSVQLLIAGPTPEERTEGYYSELNSLFSGASQCPSLGPVGGPDFTLTLNTKGTTAEQGTATLKFCRATLSPGIGADARVLSNLQATLMQFATIKKVVILNVQGNCFGDQTTQNLCLK